MPALSHPGQAPRLLDLDGNLDGIVNSGYTFTYYHDNKASTILVDQTTPTLLQESPRNCAQRRPNARQPPYGEASWGNHRDYNSNLRKRRVTGPIQQCGPARAHAQVPFQMRLENFCRRPAAPMSGIELPSVPWGGCAPPPFKHLQQVASMYFRFETGLKTRAEADSRIEGEDRVLPLARVFQIKKKATKPEAENAA